MPNDRKVGTTGHQTELHRNAVEINCTEEEQERLELLKAQWETV
jgi:hypothetical protein